MPLYTFFALIIFQIGSGVYVWAGLQSSPTIYASLMAGMTGVYHHAQLLLDEMREVVLIVCLGYLEL
jgi:hypothetical protein